MASGEALSQTPVDVSISRCVTVTVHTLSLYAYVHCTTSLGQYSGTHTCASQRVAFIAHIVHVCCIAQINNTCIGPQPKK